jgi:hypothetical protein
MSDVTENAELLEQYITICNEALQKNKDRFPFKEILNAARENGDKKFVDISVVDDNPEAEFVIHMDGSQIRAEDHESCERCNCSQKWKIRKSYLLDVVSNPDIYIENPAKIDWEWLQ